MNDLVRIDAIPEESPLGFYPKGLWVYLKNIRDTQNRIETIISANHGLIPIEHHYADSGIHTSYIIETDTLLHQLEDYIIPLLRTVRGEHLHSILTFIREGILFYRMRNPVLLESYASLLKRTYEARAHNNTLNVTEREDFLSEIEYFEDVLNYHE